MIRMLPTPSAWWAVLDYVSFAAFMIDIIGLLLVFMSYGYISLGPMNELGK